MTSATSQPSSRWHIWGIWVSALVLGLLLGQFLSAPVRYVEPAPASVSGADTVQFSLLDQHGQRASASDFTGRVLLVFFGYTHCPDICPTTLLEMREVKASLGDSAARFAGIFITVDPARDTSERLLAYIDHFDPELIGLTGTDAEIRAAANSFGAAYAREQESAGGYLMGHTAFGYLVAADGTIETVFPNEVGAKEISAAVAALLQRPETPGAGEI